METYHDPTGIPLRLAARLAAGGEGEVFRLADAPDELVKLYSRDGRGLPASQAAKLRWATTRSDLTSHRRLAWPRRLVLDRRGQVVGFTMRRVEGRSLVALSALQLRQTRFPHWTMMHLCRVVSDIASGCEFLRQRGVLPGDVSLTNFLVDPETAQVSFIDCDSYQMKTPDGCFRCTVHTPDFSPPELLRAAPGSAVLLDQSVYFSVAVLFFTVFTAGGHPYSVANGGNPVENILAGRHFLGGRGVATGYTTGAIWRRYQALSPWLKKLFKTAFIAGHAEPDQRPAFVEWSDAARDFAAGLEPAAARSARNPLP